MHMCKAWVLLALALLSPALAFFRPGSGLQSRSKSALLATASPQPSQYKPVIYAYFRSRSKIIEWYCQELNVDYSTVNIDMGNKEHKADSFLSVNPFGKLPAIEMEDGRPLFESGSILLYLADKFAGMKTAEERAVASQWCMFANASLGPALFIAEMREKQMKALFDVLEQILAKQQYLAGDAFSVSDVAVGSYLSYLPVFFPDIKLNAWPAVQAYVQRLTSRPAFKATVGAPPPTQA